MDTPTSSSGNMFSGASPKLTFIFGLVTGIAGTALVAMALFVTSGYTSSKTPKTTTTTNTAAAADTNTAPSFTNVKKVSSDDYVRGDKNAKITLIEYSDLECPFCKTYHPTVNKILSDYSGKVNFVYRHFPLSFHQNAQKEAEAALCIGKLGGADKYFDFMDKIFERTASNGTGFALTDLGPLAKEVGVNQDKFQSCLDGGEMAARVNAEEQDGAAGGATGTPTTFIVDQDGKTISAIPGAYTYDQVKASIDSALAS